MGRMPHSLIALAVALAVPLAATADPSPTPAASPHARTKATAKPLRSAVNLCDKALLYTWPRGGGVPSGSNLPPAHTGERFEIQAHRHSLDGRGYYETTIPEPSGMGGGGFYWVSDRCFNAS